MPFHRPQETDHRHVVKRYVTRKHGVFRATWY